MAIEKLHETLEPPNPQAAIRYVQFDALRILVDKEHFDKKLIELAGSAAHPGSTVSRNQIEALFQNGLGPTTSKRYDVVLTNAQYTKLIGYLERGAYFYKTQGNPDDSQFVLAFSYGERSVVNSQIRSDIERTFANKSTPIYAQWEIADMPSFNPNANLKFNRIGMDPGKDYIYSYEVVQKFMSLAGAQPGTKVFLACQAWHGPRCWKICEEHKLVVVGGIFVNLFSSNDPQPWVRDPMSWVCKESQKG